LIELDDSKPNGLGIVQQDFLPENGIRIPVITFHDRDTPSLHRASYDFVEFKRFCLGGFLEMREPHA
jgi:hypothetical protein